MSIQLTEEELRQLQISNPTLAAKLTQQIVEEAKNSIKKVVAKSTRYGTGTSAPYYTAGVANRCTLVLNALKDDRTRDLIIPERMLGRSIESARQYYSQGFNWIRDNSADFDSEYQRILPYIKIKRHTKGLMFKWLADEPEDLTPEGFIRLASGEDTDKGPTPDVLPVFNWRSKLTDWIEKSSMGARLEISPLTLSDDDVLEAEEILAGHRNNLVYSVRPEMITAKRISV